MKSKLFSSKKSSNRASRISDDFVELHKQKIKNKMKSSSYIIIPLVVLLLILIYLVSPMSRISSISINGNGYISQSDIKRELQLDEGDSIFKVIGHKNKINQRVINDDHRVKSLDFKFTGFNHLSVSVSPYKEIGYETRGNKQYLILENGKVTNIAVKNPNDSKMPYIVKFNNQSLLKSMIEKYVKLPKDIRDNIRVISYSPTKVYPDELHVYMRDGNRVIILMHDFNDKMGFYRSIATQLKTKSVINLEVGAYSFPINDEKKSSNTTTKASTKTKLKETLNKDAKKTTTTTKKRN
ncbi:MAG: cell division protein FtsQ/DivIB [Apilactobacillus kunkeei]|nr:cell division protein FtsQ/DivIB [Apilactobacillus kunkeei]